MKTEEEIIDLLKKKHGRSLPGFENINKKAIRRRAKKIINYLEKRGNRMEIECSNCDQKAKKDIVAQVYETPWESISKEKHFCSFKCMDEYLFGSHDFRYFDCLGCGRTICEQNPMNGWHTQYRFAEDEEQICLSCYEKDILKNGVPREKFENGIIVGMFFSYGNTEAIEKGFEEVFPFNNIFLKSQKTVDEYCKKALELIDQGFQVINAYESMGIGGGEGYVTMLAKKL